MAKRSIASAATEIIVEHAGPVLESELVDAIVRLELTRARDPAAAVAGALRSQRSLVRLADRRWLHLPTAVEGSVFVHRLTADEQAAEVIRLDPDLSALASAVGWRTDRHADPEQPAIANHRFAVRSPGADPDEIPPRVRVLAGPEGWLRGRRAGELVGLRCRDGRLALEEVGEPADDAAAFVALVGAAARRAWSVHRSDPYEPGVPIDDVVAEVIAHDADALRQPGLPLGDALAAAGFETRDHLAAPTGTDWAEYEDLWWEPFVPEQVDPSPVYELRIALLDLAPPIWRRVQVPARISLERLHRVIQAAMGWRQEHLFEFRIDGVAYGPPDREFGREVVDAQRIRATKIGRAPGARCQYLYDFGDGWEHEVVLERVLEPEPGVRYPRLVGGERACPPEDCGGPSGYLDFLAIVLDPRHPERRWMLNLAGGRFDPEVFDHERAEEEVAWA